MNSVKKYLFHDMKTHTDFELWITVEGSEYPKKAIIFDGKTGEFLHSIPVYPYTKIFDNVLTWLAKMKRNCRFVSLEEVEEDGSWE